MREMKDSGNKWIGDIPADWSCGKTIYYLSMPMTDGPHTTPQLYDDGVPFVSAEAVSCGRGKIDFDHIRGYISEEFYEECCKKYIPQMDDIYMIKSGATTGRVSIVDTDVKFTIWSPLAVYRVNKSLVMPKFMFYAIQSPSYMKQVEDGWNYGTQQNIGMRTLEKLKVAVPPYAEQKRIVEYLDTKWNEIDALAADIQSQIDTLEQYKRSVITEAVTKGLNKNVEMKESGSGWPGEIPSDWKMIKGKYLFTQRNDRGNNISLQLLSPTQAYGVIPQEVYEELSGMSAVKLNERTDLMNLKTIHKGDYCISLRSFQGGFEYSEYEGVVSPAYQVFYPTVPIVDGYYKYLFKEQGFIVKMNSYTMTLRDGKNIAFSDFGNTYIPYPGFNQQKVIAAYLDEKTTEIDGIVAQKKEQLTTLEAYKKSTIYEYVTGKKEVPA
ncbi:MAG: restriction endonuclease subunit S [Lachnospiraceae bacterium]|nr:restriction endonuclease subunit S [Lachnospiraceae bacterium]